jgi:hypothetical protein
MALLIIQSMKAPDLKDKLEESEKLLKEMRKTWEEKLAETEKIQTVSTYLLTVHYTFYHICEQSRSRSASKSMPSDQDLHSSLFRLK